MSGSNIKSSSQPAVRFCARCVYPTSSAAPLALDAAGLCTGCRVAGQRETVDWARRETMFRRLLDEYRSVDGSNYDCIIPVSGGKDSYYQVHLVKAICGMNPLLVTYHGNNYSPAGMRNLVRMREVFAVDHIFFTPSIDVLKAMNRLGMVMMGDMNWHAHAGIFTYPIREAVQHRVPLMIWGEHGFMDLGGMHSYNDFVEFTYRFRHEHALRGYEWPDFLAAAAARGETLERRNLIPWVYPTDEEVEAVGVRGVYVSNYFRWDANDHGNLMVEKYGFEPTDEPFERTYRTMSNLDDMHENGIHDYMKFVKFGYGRATDHVCKDIRAGILSRAEGIELVQRMDPIKSRDLQRWLAYVGWTEARFDAEADRFRDPRVWAIRDNQWVKKDIDDVWRGYGPVHLTSTDRERFFHF
ncbi:MAG: LPS biosynthesis protein [Gammaproteobacteria bacterium RIFCSPHIGHO2_12_FULL_63_22]|nr:MAG: LPS biosynthesis protein [Gammaproteobacteria bacterium RIFCSPHIGHO2_12_FULL_63_22]